MKQIQLQWVLAGDGIWQEDVAGYGEVKKWKSERDGSGNTIEKK